MSLAQLIKPNDWVSVRHAMQQIDRLLGPTSSPTFVGMTFSGLTASRLLATDSDSALSSVTDLSSWIAGTTNEIIVTSDGDGTITLSAPQAIGSGSSPTFAGLTLTGFSGVLWANAGVVTGSATLDLLGNLAANKTFNNAAYSISFNFTNPTNQPTYDGAFEIQASGAFTGDLFHVHQHTGNPGTTDLCHFEAVDDDVTILRLQHSGAGNVLEVGAIGSVKVTLDNSGNLSTKGSIYINSGGTTAVGNMKIYDQDAAEWLNFDMSNGVGYISIQGASLSALIFGNAGTFPIGFFDGCTEGLTPHLSLHGWKTGDTKRDCHIQISSTEDDTLLVTDVSNYRFAGLVKSTGLEISKTGSVGNLKIYDQDALEYLNIDVSNGVCYFAASGTSPGGIIINNAGLSNVGCFNGCAEGRTASLTVSGFRTGDSRRQLKIGISSAANNTALFSNVAEYTFDGIINATSGNSTNWNAAYTHSGLTSGNPHSVTKSDVGLGSVENTALSTWAGTSNITTVGTLTGPLSITQNSDTLQISLDGSDSILTTSDGGITVTTSEGTNTNMWLDIKGKGTGTGGFRVYDQDRAEHVELYAYSGQCFFETAGTSPGKMWLQEHAKGNVDIFGSCAEGVQKEVYIYGYKTGSGSRKSLQIGCETDANDQASFDGVSNYFFDGYIKSTNSHFITTIKSGADQASAGAAAGELWKTASHATLPDNVVMIGV